jgi:hypothetical protein
MTLTTKLDAINEMLSLIGELPINSLDGSIPADAEIAKNILDSAARDIQISGWFFNTQTCYTLAKDNDGFINVPSNTIRVEINPIKYQCVSPVLIGTKLYDSKNNTYVFTQDIVADEILFMRNFEEMPEAAKKYAVARAARIFQTRMLGSNALTQISMKDEIDAKADLMDWECQASEANLLQNPDIAKAIYGRY